MQFSTLILSAAVASFTYAQSAAILEQQAKIPVCGVTCLTTAAGAAGCDITDYACQCGRGREAITQSAIPCVVSTCQPTDLASITQISTEICRLAAMENISSGAASATSSIASQVSSVVNSVTRSVGSQTTGSVTGTPTGSAAQVSATGGAGRQVVGGLVGVGALVAVLL